MIIQGRVAQIRRAFAVHQKLDTVPLHDRVAGLLRIERHFILQPGTTALRDLHAQTFAALSLLFQEHAKLSDGVLRDVNHRGYEAIALTHQVKLPVARRVEENRSLAHNFIRPKGWKI